MILKDLLCLNFNHLNWIRLLFEVNIGIELCNPNLYTFAHPIAYNLL